MFFFVRQLIQTILTTGILQSSGQGKAPRAAGHRQGQVLQPSRRREDQGRGRSVRVDSLINYFKLFKCQFV